MVCSIVCTLNRSVSAHEMALFEKSRFNLAFQEACGKVMRMRGSPVFMGGCNMLGSAIYYWERF